MSLFFFICIEQEKKKKKKKKTGRRDLLGRADACDCGSP